LEREFLSYLWALKRNGGGEAQVQDRSKKKQQSPYVSDGSRPRRKKGHSPVSRQWAETWHQLAINIRRTARAWGGRKNREKSKKGQAAEGKRRGSALFLHGTTVEGKDNYQGITKRKRNGPFLNGWYEREWKI